MKTKTSKKIRTEFWSKNIITAILMVLFFSTMIPSCSGDNNDSEDDQGNGNNIDFTEISGEYSGTASNSLGTIPISIRVRPRNIANEYSVEFYSSSNLVSCCNSNGNPEALGDLTVDGEQLNINLRWNTDTPPCRGDYTGRNGTFDIGAIRIAMDAMLDCSEVDTTDDFLLTKVANL